MRRMYSEKQLRKIVQEEIAKQKQSTVAKTAKVSKEPVKPVEEKAK